MKKIILSVVTLTLLASQAFSQGASIRIKGTPTDISGTVINADASDAAQDGHLIDFSVDNISGMDQNWSLMRIRLTPSIGWTDQVCWGAVSTGWGECITPTGDSFTTNYTVPVATTTTDAEINTYIEAPTGGSSSFRYYIMDGSTKVDSVDLTITKSLSINENASLTLTVAPNPATNVVNINMDGITSADLKIMDVLGNIVMKETVFESAKKVDVSKYKNGIYFITVNAEGMKPITRKLVVRH